MPRVERTVASLNDANLAVQSIEWIPRIATASCQTHTAVDHFFQHRSFVSRCKMIGIFARRACETLMWSVGIIVATGTAGTSEESFGSTTSWRDVDRWMVEAESELIFLHDGTANESKRSLVHRVIAVAAPGDLYFYTGHDNSLVADSWRHEPFNLEVTIHGEQQTSHYKFNRRFSRAVLQKGSEIPRTVSNDALFFMVPAWPLRDYQPPQDKSTKMVFVIQGAMDSGQYRPADEHQMINGEMCTKVVSSNGLDEIWVADAKQFCIMRRSWCDQHTGAVKTQLVTLRLGEVAPGLWMPIEFEETRFAANANERNPKPIRRAVTRVLSCRLGDRVPLDLFEAKIQQGSIIVGENGDFHQVSPGGTDHLDDVAAYLRDQGGLPERSHASQRVLLIRAACITLGIVFGCLCGLLLLRCRERVSPSDPASSKTNSSVGVGEAAAADGGA